MEPTKKQMEAFREELRQAQAAVDAEKQKAANDALLDAALRVREASRNALSQLAAMPAPPPDLSTLSPVEKIRLGLLAYDDLSESDKRTTAIQSLPPIDSRGMSAVEKISLGLRSR